MEGTPTPLSVREPRERRPTLRWAKDASRLGCFTTNPVFFRDAAEICFLMVDILFEEGRMDLERATGSEYCAWHSVAYMARASSAVSWSRHVLIGRIRIMAWRFLGGTGSPAPARWTELQAR